MGSRLRFSTPHLELPAARVGETTTRSATISNTSDVWVEILDFSRKDTARSEIASSGIDDTALEPGESTPVHFLFTPTREGRVRQLLFAETDQGPDIGIELGGNGRSTLAAAVAAHEPGARDEAEAADKMAHEASATSAVHHGRVPALATYADLEAAFGLVFELAERNEWTEATTVANALVERMIVLCEPDHMRAAFHRQGVTGATPERYAYMAQDAVNNVYGRLPMKTDLYRARNFEAFRGAATVLRALTGERTDLSDFRAFDRHTLGLAAVTAIPVAVAVLPYLAAELPALAPLLAEEASLLAYATRSLFATITTWIATHPDEALAWAEVATSVGVDAGENPEGFYQKLQTPEGWYEIALNVLMTVLPARNNRMGTSGDEVSAEATSRPPRGGPGVDPEPGPASRGATRSRVLGDPEVVEAASATSAARLRTFAAAARNRADQTLGREGGSRDARFLESNANPSGGSEPSAGPPHADNPPSARVQGPGAAHVHDESFSANRVYEASPKHTGTDRVAGGIEIAARPKDGHAALDFSFAVGGNSRRRVGVDVANDEIVVFDRTGDRVVDKKIVGGVYHGHVRGWDKLTPAMKAVLVEHRVVDRRGRLRPEARDLETD